jgi:hypothetical protein
MTDLGYKYPSILTLEALHSNLISRQDNIKATTGPTPLIF